MSLKPHNVTFEIIISILLILSFTNKTETNKSGNHYKVSRALNSSFISHTQNLRYRKSSGNEKSVEEDLKWPVKKVAEMEGDIVLGALMMIHQREDKLICGPIMPQGGIQALECMLYTVDWINNQKFLPGFKLGLTVLDDCDKDIYGLEQALDFIKGSISNTDEGWPDESTRTRGSNRQKKISGVIGAASSSTSILVAKLLRLFRIPQVSYFSTSPELSDKNRFPFFLRTVPSDLNQVDAMVQIVKRLNWTYVSILYEESSYGTQAFSVLEDLLSKNGICIAVHERLTKDSGVAEAMQYNEIVQKIMEKPKARGVIIYGSDQEVAGVMRAVRRNGATGNFSWIGSDGWSARALVFEGHEDEVEGTLSIQPAAHSVAGFEDYFLSLKVENNKRNPWFIEFWEHFFHCKWPNSTVTPYNIKEKNLCTGQEVISKKNGYKPEGQLQFVSDAVLVFAHALKNMHENLCEDQPGLCSRMQPIDGTTLLTYLRNTSFKGLSGDEFHFSENGDGPARYNIIHFKQVFPGNYQWLQVGKYEDGQLLLNLSEVRFRMDEPDIPTSVCSLPCGNGEVKNFLKGERCCWHCNNCSNYQILQKETQCSECPLGYLPNEKKKQCEEIPISFMNINSGWAIGAILFSTIGILVTSLTVIIFFKFNATPVVKASGKELTYAILITIIMSYSMTYILVKKPNALLCGIQEIGIPTVFTMLYSALTIKAIRIYRIFNAGARRAQQACISPKSQLFMCGLITVLQLIISAMWLGFIRRSANTLYFRTRDQNQLMCAYTVDVRYLVSLTLPGILIIKCTVYAILTRKIPAPFNESKLIGFAIYSTFIIWAAVLSIYKTTASHVEINTFIMSTTINCSSTVILICLYSKKIYIILFHPEKNIHQSRMRNRSPTPRCEMEMQPTVN